MAAVKQTKKALAGFLALVMLAVFTISGTVLAADEQAVTLTFSEDAITETVAGEGYSIDGTALSITAAGTYVISGSCSEGSISVAKGLSDVVLIFNNLNLASSITAPVVVKKTSSVTISLEGESTLTNNEDASTEDTNEDFEGAAIKVKSGSSVTFTGEGTLNIAGNAKNGIKGASTAALTFNSGTYNVTAVNNGIASDGSLVFNGGAYVINSENDGIKAVPDADDTDSAGTLEINGGTYTITAGGDGIQAEQDLMINNGVFDIMTFGGYNTTGYDEDTMSCKGIKASGDREDVEKNLLINGGSFTLNTRDDAIHSDGNVTVTGGSFTIRTGDDGVHADTSLTLGTENGYDRDPEITILTSYEGLEGGNVYVFSGKFYVVASDDGINAAGGSSSGTDPGQGGGNTFNPGGRPGGQAGWGGFPGQQTAAGDYNIYVYGGDLYVDCTGDGLDSNGGLYLNGGNVTVFSMAAGGDNSPIDADGTIQINGATVCAAGAAGMDGTLRASNFSQNYYQTNVSKNAGTIINIYQESDLLYSDKLPRRINYLLYTSPNMSSGSCTVQNADSVTACKSHAWAHNWDTGVIVKEATETESGLMKYTCKDCGEEEYKTISGAVSSTGGDSRNDSGNDSGDDSSDNGNQDSNRIFDDVNEGDWFYETVMNVYNWTNVNGTRLMSGYANTKLFGPADPLERAQFAVMLNRLADDDTTGAEYDASIFADVADGQFYTQAVMWANANGLITGYGNGSFGVSDNITREQLATILYRYVTMYLGKNVEEAMAAGNLDSFPDEASVSDFAKDAMTFAVGAGIIQGNADGTLNPLGSASRAECATMFMRFINYLETLA